MRRESDNSPHSIEGHWCPYVNNDHAPLCNYDGWCYDCKYVYQEGKCDLLLPPSEEKYPVAENLIVNRSHAITRPDGSTDVVLTGRCGITQGPYHFDNREEYERWLAKMKGEDFPDGFKDAVPADIEERLENKDNGKQPA